MHRVFMRGLGAASASSPGTRWHRPAAWLLIGRLRQHRLTGLRMTGEGEGDVIEVVGAARAGGIEGVVPRER
jgi:hypothetical protein